MLKIVNKFKEPLNVLHFCGQSINDFPKTLPYVYNSVVLNPISDIDIISCWTEDDKCILYKQLSKFGIKLINAVPSIKTKEWYMPYKICYILSALINKTTSDVVMILDGYDVLMASTDGLLEKFKSQPYRILFNATPHNYPNENIDVIPNRENFGHYKYFNAGCCIGYRKDLIKFYSEAINFINIENPLNSEQKILRHAFAKYSEDLSQTFIGIDYNNLIFNTTGKTQIAYDMYSNTMKIDPIEQTQ